MTFLSLAIPAYEANGKGTEVLEYSFRQLAKQKFDDFEIIIADHSQDNNFQIENLCYNWHTKLNIFHYRNPEMRGNPAANTNYAISKAKGRYIRVLCQDDIILDENSLQNLRDEIDDDYLWYISAYYHSWDRINLFNLHIPTMNPNIEVVNTFGTPSAMTMKNVIGLPQMDTNLLYCYDEDYYKQMIDKYGMPKFIYKPDMINFLWGNSISSKITEEQILRESRYILKKYGK